MSSKELKDLTINELHSLLTKEQGSSLASVAVPLKQQDIDGSVLADSINDLKSLFEELQITKIGQKRALTKFIETYQPIHQTTTEEGEEMAHNTQHIPPVDPSQEVNIPPDVPVKIKGPEVEKKLSGVVPLITKSSRTGVKVKAIAVNHEDPNNMKVYLIVDPKTVPIEELSIEAFGPTTVTLSGGPLKEPFEYSFHLDPPATYLPAKIFNFFDTVTSTKIVSSGKVKFVEKKSGNEVKTINVSNGKLDLSSLSLPNGIYDLECSFDGYSSSTYPNIFFNGMWSAENEKTLFMDLNSRTNSRFDLITLRWDENPRDLDLHVVSNRGDHVFYSHKKSGNFELDVDVTTGKGPETLTITPANHNYLVYVHLYSGSGELYTSNARLRVRLISTNSDFDLAVPRTPIPGHPLYWKAFAVIGGKLVTYNKVQCEEPHL